MGKNLKGKEIGEGILQRKDGFYSARFRSASGSRVEKRFRKLSEAKKWMAEARYQDMQGNLAFSTDMVLDAWFDIWISDVLGDRIKYNTRKCYEGRYRHRISPCIGGMVLSDIQPIHCQHVLNYCREKGDTSGSMKKIRSIMKACLESAVENRLILVNPVSNSVRYRTGDQTERTVLTVEEQKCFVETAKGSQHYDEFLFVLNTGLRCGEMMALKWSDIDWERRTIHVNGTLFFNRDEGHFEENPPKTAAGNRTIPLTDMAYQILESRKGQVRPSSEFQEYIFLNELGRPTLQTVYNRCLKRVTDRLGIEKFSMHCLRHTFATRCIESGMKPKTLQKILGHTRISMTMDLYVHTTEDEMAREMRNFELMSA